MGRMSKIFFGILCGVWVFNGAFCAETQLEKLIRQKQHKVDVLQECTKQVKGFKVAGISTLGLTAGGIAGNVLLSQKQKQLESELDAKRVELSKQEKTLLGLKKKIRRGMADKEKKQATDFIESSSTEIQEVELKPEVSKSCPGDAYKRFLEVCPNCDSDYTKSALCDEVLDDRWFSSGFEVAEDGKGVWVYHYTEGYEFSAVMIYDCDCKWVKDAEKQRRAEGRPLFNDKK